MNEDIITASVSNSKSKPVDAKISFMNLLRRHEHSDPECVDAYAPEPPPTGSGAGSRGAVGNHLLPPILNGRTPPVSRPASSWTPSFLTPSSSSASGVPSEPQQSRRAALGDTSERQKFDNTPLAKIIWDTISSGVQLGGGRGVPNGGATSSVTDNNKINGGGESSSSGSFSILDQIKAMKYDDGTASPSSLYSSVTVVSEGQQQFTSNHFSYHAETSCSSVTETTTRTTCYHHDHHDHHEDQQSSNSTSTHHTASMKPWPSTLFSTAGGVSVTEESAENIDDLLLASSPSRSRGSTHALTLASATAKKGGGGATAAAAQDNLSKNIYARNKSRLDFVDSAESSLDCKAADGGYPSSPQQHAGDEDERGGRGTCDEMERLSSSSPTDTPSLIKVGYESTPPAALTTFSIDKVELDEDDDHHHHDVVLVSHRGGQSQQHGDQRREQRPNECKKATALTLLKPIEGSPSSSTFARGSKRGSADGNCSSSGGGGSGGRKSPVVLAPCQHTPHTTTTPDHLGNAAAAASSSYHSTPTTRRAAAGNRHSSFGSAAKRFGEMGSAIKAAASEDEDLSSSLFSTTTNTNNNSNRYLLPSIVQQQKGVLPALPSSSAAGGGEDTTRTTPPSFMGGATTISTDDYFGLSPAEELLGGGGAPSILTSTTAVSSGGGTAVARHQEQRTNKRETTTGNNSTTSTATSARTSNPRVKRPGPRSMNAVSTMTANNATTAALLDGPKSPAATILKKPSVHSRQEDAADGNDNSSLSMMPCDDAVAMASIVAAAAAKAAEAVRALSTSTPSVSSGDYVGFLDDEGGHDNKKVVIQGEHTTLTSDGNATRMLNIQTQNKAATGGQAGTSPLLLSSPSSTFIMQSPQQPGDTTTTSSIGLSPSRRTATKRVRPLRASIAVAGITASASTSSGIPKNPSGIDSKGTGTGTGGAGAAAAVKKVRRMSYDGGSDGGSTGNLLLRNAHTILLPHLEGVDESQCSGRLGDNNDHGKNIGALISGRRRSVSDTDLGGLVVDPKAQDLSAAVNALKSDPPVVAASSTAVATVSNSPAPGALSSSIASAATSSQQGECWESVSEQPFCALCDRIFKSTNQLNTHLKFSRAHELKVAEEAEKKKKAAIDAAAATATATADMATTASTTAVEQGMRRSSKCANGTTSQFSAEEKYYPPVNSGPSPMLPLPLPAGLKDGDSVIASRADVKLMYSGTKYFAGSTPETRGALELEFHLHTCHDVVEIITFDPDRDRETERIYLAFGEVRKCLDERNIVALSERVAESRGIQGAQVAEACDVETAARLTASTFILGRLRLRYVPSRPHRFIAFIPLYGDREDAKILLDRPPSGLAPFYINRNRRYSQEEYHASAVRLDQDRKDARELMDNVEKILEQNAQRTLQLSEQSGLQEVVKLAEEFGKKIHSH